MIKNNDLHEEIALLEEAQKKETDAYKKAMLKASILQIKLLHNQRTNLVSIMEKLGAEKVKPKDTPVDAKPLETKGK